MKGKYFMLIFVCSIIGLIIRFYAFSQSNLGFNSFIDIIPLALIAIFGAIGILRIKKSD